MESSRNGHLLELLGRAKRRHLWQVAVEQGSLALAITFGAVILLLVLGTEILDWYWPAGILVAGLAVALIRARKRVPTSYKLLQAVDGRCGLRDSLSTAFFFSELADTRRFSEGARSLQRVEADRMSQQIDIRSAVPFHFPAAAYFAILMLTGAVTLLGLRYGVLHTLDLRPPIANAVASFFRPTKEVAELKKDPKPPAQKEAPVAIPVSDQQRNADQGNDSPTETQQMMEAASRASNENGQPLREGETPEGNDKASEGSEDKPGDSAGKEGDQPTPPSSASEQAKNGNEGKRPPAPQQQDNDLLRKMQDAFANLMAKLKMPPRAGEGSRVSEKGGDEAGKGSKKEGQKGRETPASADAEGTPTSDPQGARSTEAGQQAREGKGQGGDQVSDRPGQEQARSGAGSKDGNKDTREQEQLEALGKLSEILGKRAENITGEVMIEVGSGDQRLRTAYSDTKSAHRAAGGEIHRDEVPLMLQPYVQRYFEEVRKTEGKTQPSAQ